MCTHIADASYTPQQLISYFQKNNSATFSAAVCLACSITINLASLPYETGWLCPICSNFNNGNWWTRPHTIPHQRPDHGPTYNEIITALANAIFNTNACKPATNPSARFIIRIPLTSPKSANRNRKTMRPPHNQEPPEATQNRNARTQT